METSYYESLSSLLEECKTWSTKGVFVEGYVLNDDGKEEKAVLDICEHIGCDSNDPVDQKRHLSDFQSRLKRGKAVKVYLPPAYNEYDEDGRKKMIKHIVNRFDACGGGIVATGQTGNDGAPSVRFQCFRHKVQSTVKKGKENAKSTSSSRPQKQEDKCKWRLNVEIETKVASMIGRFFIYMNGSGNRFHTGHVAKQEHEIMKRKSQLDEDELEIVEDGMDVNLGSHAMAMMFKKRTGLTVDPKKLRNHQMRKQNRNKSPESSKLTPAEDVINQLTSSKEVSVVYLLANVEVGEELVTTYTGTKKSKSNQKVSVTFESNVATSGQSHESQTMSESDIMATSQFTDGETPTMTAIDIYNSLKINGGTQILLCIAWCTNKQRRYLSLFPESITSDVVMKMNNEKRPSMHWCSKTSMNETFGGAYSFLASQATWCFDFSWGVMLPAIADPRVIVRNKLTTTDNDIKLYGPYEQLQVPSRYVNGKHRLCCFHGMTQNWAKNGISNNRVLNGLESHVGVAILDAIKLIVMSWTNDVESPEELQVSYGILIAILNDEQLMEYFDDSFPSDVMTFVTTKVWIRRDKFAHYNFMHVRSFGTRTSNSSEVEGGVLKHHTAGPKPNHSLGTSADSTNKVSDMRIELKEKRAAKAMDTLPTELEEELVPLYEEVTDYASSIIAGNWKRRRSKTVFRAEPGKFWVKSKSFKKYSAADPKNNEAFLKHLSVRFERTRVVEVFRHGGRLFLKCSCCGYEEHGYLCDDICAVLNEAPKPRDVVIRWHKPYYAMYLNGNPTLDMAFDRLVENENPGPLLPANSADTFRMDFPVGECTTGHDKEYFESTLPSVTPKLHPGTKWATAGPHASTNDQATAAANHGSSNQAPVGIQTVVALSQVATESNQAYFAFASQQDDNDFPVDDEQDDAEMSKVDESMDTYGSISPERPTTKVARPVSAYHALKPQWETLCNTVGTDAELIEELREQLHDFHVKAMAKRRSNSTSQTTAGGIQSFPAMDTARKSVRLEACPTGNHAAGKSAKKRAAKKQPWM